MSSSGGSPEDRTATVLSQKRSLGIVLVDPLPVVRAGMALLVNGASDMEIVAEVGSADECLQAIRRLRRSRVMVLVGLNLEGDHDGYWLIRQLRESFPAAVIVGCGANADSIAISRALFGGADGFVDKNVEPGELLQALRRAADGEMVLAGPPTEWVGPIADAVERRREAEMVLTARELDVLTLAAEGITAREIAGRLGVRERTITTHLGRIYGKLGVHGRVAAIRQAARSGLLSVASGE